MLYGALSLGRDPSLEYNVVGGSSYLGYYLPPPNASDGVPSFTSNGSWSDAYHTSLDQTIQIGSTLSFSMDHEHKAHPRIVKSLEFVNSAYGPVFFEKFYFDVGNDTLVPFKLAYYTPSEKKTLLHLQGITTILNNNLPSVMKGQYLNPRLEIFTKSVLQPSPATAAFEKVYDGLAARGSFNHLVHCDLSTRTVEEDLTFVTSLLDGKALSKTRLLVPKVINSIIPTIDAHIGPLIERIFMASQPVNSHELSRSVLVGSPIDLSIGIPLDIVGSRREIGKTHLSAIADILDKAPFTDVDMIVAFDINPLTYTASSTKIHKMGFLFDRYECVIGLSTSLDYMKKLCSALTYAHYCLRTLSSPDTTVRYARIRKTFLDEAVIDILDDPERLDLVPLSIHLDLALLSICSYGITSGVDAIPYSYHPHS